MGSVYLANHTEISDLAVAIKLLAQNCLDNESLRQRFRDEAAICARLGERSPHIVQIRDYGILDDLDQPYYAMELLLGRSLAEVIRPGGPHLSLEQTISISHQLCEGLKVAHEAGVVHRDLKPSNIFLIPDPQFGERAKVLDFGIAKFLNEASKTHSGPLTQGYIGTPRYSSPEQLAGKAVDCRSDLYSLGVILYELLCGESPFAVADESFTSWYRAHQETPPRSMATANPAVAVPIEVERVVQQCLGKDPQIRPADVGEVGLRLDNALRRFNEHRRRVEGQQILDRATALSAAARWDEASRLIEGIGYDSPVFGEAQRLLKTWQMETEYQRVLEEARRIAADGDAAGLLRALSAVATIASTSACYRPAQVESQGWIESIFDSARDLARGEKWSEALQRIELIGKLPGMSGRVAPLAAQWLREQQATEVLRRAESFAAEQRWQEAVQMVDQIGPGTVSQTRGLQRRALWLQKLQTRSAAVRPARAVTLLADQTLPEPETPSIDVPAPPPRPTLPWLIGISAALTAVVFGFFALVSPPNDGLKPVRASIAQARQAADAQHWPTVFEQLEQVSAPSGSTEATQVKELLDRATSGQLALVKARFAEQNWKEGYDMARLLIDRAPDGIERSEARKLLGEISDRWGAELLQGALSNGNLGRLQDDKILLRQAIETARQVPPESGRYTSAQRYIKEWEDALKTL